MPLLAQNWPRMHFRDKLDFQYVLKLKTQQRSILRQQWPNADLNMKAGPSTHGSGGQDHRGRFSPGNKLGRGNPLAGRAAKIRSVLLSALTEDDAGEIARRLIQQAKGGDLASIRELFDRTIGKAGQQELLERLERLEAAVAKGEQHGHRVSD